MIVITGSKEEQERVTFNTEVGSHEQVVVGPNVLLDNVIAGLELAVEHFKQINKQHKLTKEAQAKADASAKG